MAQYYQNVTQYVIVARDELQDLILPYRYNDAQVVHSLNSALRSIARVRPDIFIDLKYQMPLRKGDIDDGMVQAFTTNDIAFLSDGVTYDPTNGTMVPIPAKYVSPVNWYVSGWLQILDVADTQDQRAQAFMQKFQAQLLTVAAA